MINLSSLQGTVTKSLWLERLHITEDVKYDADKELSNPVYLAKTMTGAIAYCLSSHADHGDHKIYPYVCEWRVEVTCTKKDFG